MNSELERDYHDMSSLASKKQFVIYTCFVVCILAFISGMAYWYEANTVRLTMLMYHQVTDSAEDSPAVSAETFESHIKALIDAGYTAISFEELRDYVVDGTPLPDQPVMITLDDGYTNTYDSAYPILQKYNMKATVFIVGVYFGENVYKGAYYLPIEPHFGDAEAREMASSGIISIQSHSYDMHQFMPYEPDTPRLGILRRSGESREEYIEAFITDYALSADQIESITGERPFVYSYPFGRRVRLAERLLKDMGVTVTVITGADFCTVARDKPGSLFGLGRLNVPGDMTADELLDTIRY